MTFIEFIELIITVSALAVVVALSLSHRPVQDARSDEDVINLLKSGRRIDAIKAYRQLHQCGIKQALSFISNISNPIHK